MKLYSLPILAKNTNKAIFLKHRIGLTIVLLQSCILTKKNATRFDGYTVQHIFISCKKLKYTTYHLVIENEYLLVFLTWVTQSSAYAPFRARFHW